MAAERRGTKSLAQPIFWIRPGISSLSLTPPPPPAAAAARPAWRCACCSSTQPRAPSAAPSIHLSRAIHPPLHQRRIPNIQHHRATPPAASIRQTTSTPPPTPTPSSFLCSLNLLLLLLLQSPRCSHYFSLLLFLY